MATSIPSLLGIRILCQCKKPHIQLRGTHPIFRKPWTAVAEPYPRGFSKVIACAAACDLGWQKEKLNIAGCARAGSLRIGEAEHPGPRQRLVPRGFSLEEAPVNLPQTIRLGEDGWKQFLTWAAKEIVSCEPLELFCACPFFWHIAFESMATCSFGKVGLCCIIDI